MKIEFKEMFVNPDGTVPGGGSVGMEEFARISDGSGCSLENCHCSDGWWISMGTKVVNGKRQLAKVTFDSHKELTEFLRSK